ncbi:MAG: hypothetical protein LBR16_01555 [Treponema sp.]|jgi:hypothetical protein|nr:hypothetical protein [Treponema sp.]
MKALVPFVLYLPIASSLAAQVSSRFSIGPEWGKTAEVNANHDESTQSALGAGAANYTLFGVQRGGGKPKPAFGFFVRADALFPGAIPEENDLIIYDFSLQADVLAGLAFGAGLSGRLDFYLGAGPDAQGLFCLYQTSPPGMGTVKYERNALRLGLGLDSGINYHLAKRFFLNAGVVLAFYFSEYETMRSRFGDYSGFAASYFGFAAKIYLGLGLELTP